MANVHKSAERLLNSIDAPTGSVGTLAASDRSGKYIRVFIDPMYWLYITGLPRTFDGFRVTVEKKEPTKTLSHSL
jgi:hypothetical protein